MRRKLLPFVLGGALSVAAVAPAAAAPVNAPVAVGPFGSLIGVVVQLNDVLNNSLNDVVEVNISDSLNNLLQNANIEVLNGLEVTIQNVLNNLNVTVQDIEITVLENGDVQIVVLGTGGIVDTITLG